MPRGDQGFQIVIDPMEWYRFKQELDKFDPALAKALRKRIRNAGDVAAREVKATLAMPSPGDGPDSGKGRAALIAATRVSVSFAKKAAGAKITTGSSGLSAAHKGLLKVYNKETFRHPVFETAEQSRGRKGNSLTHRFIRGSRANWVAQKGRPYFGLVIHKTLNKIMVREVESALQEAAAAIGARSR